VAAYAVLEAFDVLMHPPLELRKPAQLHDAELTSTPAFIHGFFTTLVAVAGLWVMLHFHRVPAWMHCRNHSTTSQLQTSS
jgi:hypothetical protein